jgi:hypothetical protein
LPFQFNPVRERRRRTSPTRRSIISPATTLRPRSPTAERYDDFVDDVDPRGHT